MFFVMLAIPLKAADVAVAWVDDSNNPLANPRASSARFLCSKRISFRDDLISSWVFLA